MSSLQSSPFPTPFPFEPALVFRPGPFIAPVVESVPVAVGDMAGPGAGGGDSPLLLGADVYRRRRLVALAVVIGLVLGLMSFGRQAGANRTPEAEAAETVTVVVQPGDTLWDIARSLAPGHDPRPLADALSDLVGGTAIQPGQRIVVPPNLVD